MRPLAIDLFCGLVGWTEGLLDEGYDVVGFDIERHEYAVPEINESLDGMEGSNSQPRTRLLRYPAQLVLQDVLTLHGSQFRDAALIVASPPCQEYSYMAMPWSRAKAIAAEYRAGKRDVKKLTQLFNACFRIQREACEAAGRHIPLVIENVRGAQKWVGRARWNYGSFYLWGDVPALMLFIAPRTTPKAAFSHQPNGATIWDAYRERMARKNGGIPHAMMRDGHSHTRHLTNPAEHGVKCGGDWFNAEQPSVSRLTSSKSPARKAASAMIAKIPLPLSRHIARTYRHSALPLLEAAD